MITDPDDCDYVSALERVLVWADRAVNEPGFGRNDSIFDELREAVAVAKTVRS